MPFGVSLRNWRRILKYIMNHEDVFYECPQEKESMRKYYLPYSKINLSVKKNSCLIPNEER